MSFKVGYKRGVGRRGELESKPGIKWNSALLILSDCG